MHSSNVVVSCVLAVTMIGCGKGGPSSETSGSADLSAVEELKGIEQEINRAVDAVVAPIDETDALLNDLKSAPQRLDLDATAFGVALVAALQGAPIVGPDGAPLEAAAQAEIQQIGERLLAIVAKLQDTPDNVATLLAKVAEAIVKIPVLAVAGQASAQITASNPFAGDSDKQQAQADLQALAQLPASIIAKIQEAQAKIMTLPQRAVQAVAQLATLAGSVDLAALAKARAKVTVGKPPPAQPTVAATAVRTGDLPVSMTLRAAPQAPAAPAGKPGAMQPIAALELVGHRIQVGRATVIEGLERADAMLAELREAPRRLQVPRRWFGFALIAAAQGSPLVLPNGSSPAPEVEAEIRRLGERLLQVLAELQATPRDVEELGRAAEEGLVLVPTFAAYAEATSQAWLNSSRPSDAFQQQAQIEVAVEERTRIQELHLEAVAVMEKTLAEIPPLPQRASDSTRALLQALPTTALDLRAMASAKVKVVPLLGPLPPVAPPPTATPAPAPPQVIVQVPPPTPCSPAQQTNTEIAARAGKAGDASDNEPTVWPWYVASVVLAGGGVGALAYTLDRDSALGDCIARAPGAGCANTDSLRAQGTAGLVFTVALFEGALAALIIGLLQSGGDSDDDADHEAAFRCTPGGSTGATCHVRF